MTLYTFRWICAFVLLAFVGFVIVTWNSQTKAVAETKQVSATNVRHELFATIDGCKVYRITEDVGLAGHMRLYVAKCSDGSRVGITK